MSQSMMETVTALTQSLKDVPPLCKDTEGEKDWTRHAKLAVCKVAKPKGVKEKGINRIYGNNCTTEDHLCYADDSEWLFDLVWAVEKEDWRMQKIVLVMESEWAGRCNQKYDFQKLLIAKARIKLFVFQERSIAAANDAIEEFRKMIKSYEDKSSEESYLFAGLHTVASDKKRQFKFWHLDSHGSDIGDVLT